MMSGWHCEVLGVGMNECGEGVGKGMECWNGEWSCFVMDYEKFVGRLTMMTRGCSLQIEQ
jgi:hypothetical protein